MTVCILNEKKVPLKGQTIVLIFGTSIELHLNLPQNCHTKNCTRHYAKPLLGAGVLSVVSLLSIFYGCLGGLAW
jgi:hypothetical protein